MEEKSVIREVWNKIKEKVTITDGITAIEAVVIALISLLALGNSVFEIGKYHYVFGIPISILDTATPVSNHLVLFLLGGCFLVAYTIEGIYCYRTCRLARYVFLWLGVIFVLFWVPAFFLSICAGEATHWRKALSLLLMVFLLDGSINVGIIGVCLSPNPLDNLDRKKTQLKIIEKQLKQQARSGRTLQGQEKEKSKKVKTLKQAIKKQKAKVKERYGDEVPVRKKEKWHKAIAIYLCIVVPVTAMIIFGLVDAYSERDYATVVNPEAAYGAVIHEVSEEYPCNQMVVLYQDRDIVILAPGYQDGASLSIYKDYQSTVSLEEVSLHYDTYKKVNIL